MHDLTKKVDDVYIPTCMKYVYLCIVCMYVWMYVFVFVSMSVSMYVSIGSMYILGR